MQGQTEAGGLDQFKTIWLSVKIGNNYKKEMIKKKHNHFRANKANEAKRSDQSVRFIFVSDMSYLWYIQ